MQPLPHTVRRTLRRTLLALLLPLLPALAPPAVAGEFVGELCWEREGGTLVRLGITRMGEGFLQLNGTADTSDPGTTPLHGTALVVDDAIYMTIDFMGEDPTRTWRGSARVVVDAATLDGTVEILELFHFKDDPDPTSTETQHADPVPFLSVPCP